MLDILIELLYNFNYFMKNERVIVLLNKILERCPNCNSELIVTRLECPNCNTKIESQYKPCRFCRLSDESLEFIEVFVKNRGNIKEMERELGISYPTVRNRLMGVIEELGYKSAVEYDKQEIVKKRMDILEKIKTGEISVNEAVEEFSNFK